MFGRKAAANAAVVDKSVIIRGRPADRLPPNAAAKFAAIDNLATEAMYVSRGISENHQSIVREFQDEQRDFERAKRIGFATQELNDAAAARVEEKRDHVNRSRARLDAAHDARDVAGGLRRNIEKWIEALPASLVLKDVDAPKARPLKNEPIEDAIERLRLTIRELRAKALDVRSAPITAAEAKAILKQYVSFLEGVGEPDLQHLLDAGRRRIDWPDRLIEVGPVFGLGQYSAPPALPSVAFAAWLDPDKLYARLCKQVDDEADDSIALSASDRLKKSMSIAADGMAAAREEETLIAQARSSGLVIARRADADPRAVLGLSSDLPPPEDSI